MGTPCPCCDAVHLESDGCGPILIMGFGVLLGAGFANVNQLLERCCKAHRELLAHALFRMDVFINQGTRSCLDEAET